MESPVIAYGNHIHYQWNPNSLPIEIPFITNSIPIHSRNNHPIFSTREFLQRRVGGMHRMYEAISRSTSIAKEQY